MYTCLCSLFNFTKHVIVVDIQGVFLLAVHTEQHSAAVLEEVCKEASSQHSSHNIAAL